MERPGADPSSMYLTGRLENMLIRRRRGVHNARIAEGKAEDMNMTQEGHVPNAPVYHV